MQIIMNNTSQNYQIWPLRRKVSWAVDSYEKWGLADVDRHWNPILIKSWRALFKHKTRIKLLDLVQLVASPLLCLLLESIGRILHVNILLRICWHTSVLVGSVLLILLIHLLIH